MSTSKAAKQSSIDVKRTVGNTTTEILMACGNSGTTGLRELLAFGNSGTIGPRELMAHGKSKLLAYGNSGTNVSYMNPETNVLRELGN